MINFKIFNRLILPFHLLVCNLVLAQSENLIVKEDSLITKLMLAKKEIDRDLYKSQFFTIQLYYGELIEAEKVIEKFKKEFPEWEVELSFETPNYKVQIGNYKDYYFGMNKLKEIKSVFRKVDLMCNQVNESVGFNLDTKEMYLMVLYLLNENSIDYNKIDVNKLYQEMENLVLSYPPVILNQKIVPILRVLKEKCDSILSTVLQNKNSWEKAIVQNSTNSSPKGIIFNQSSGDMYWDMQNIDKSLFIGINNLEMGEYSEPLYYEDEKGNMGFRILKLEDRTKPHKANLNDDYEFIKKYAVNEKQVKEMDNWVTKIVKNSYIKVDDLYKGCPKISKWNLDF